MFLSFVDIEPLSKNTNIIERDIIGFDTERWFPVLNLGLAGTVELKDNYPGRVNTDRWHEVSTEY